MTNLKSGDTAICVEADGLEKYGIELGGRYPVNSVTILPDVEEEYANILVGDGDEKGNGYQIVMVNVRRLEVAHTVKFRIWIKDGSYALLDDSFNEEDHKDKEGPHADINITLPESKLENIEDVLREALAALREAETNVEESNTTH